ncbi:hypothetical protein [Micromonospora noduli]|uniref:Uncharacterized protein n=1 Tax=Micromonospora noduli TaxID=709876 RepID=A0ABX9CZS9_9ACTN|nr:hypothetical protein [Micromonospora noduli]RAO16314.1 hypothetical protein MED15_03833 [Micromonospora noduli]RAO19854.1 hypothetical protein GUI43_00491 [Micromonospora noduli]RAO46631.1 hypothetical protein ONO86_03167 [Micromonospora noduli]
MADDPEELAQVNAVRINDSGELEFFDGQRWVPYTDLPDDANGPLGVVFRDDPR